MVAVEKKALYNLLRLHWLNDTSLKVENWQIEDYSNQNISKLFQLLKKCSIDLDENSFVAYADECDSPEDLTDHLIGDRSLETKDEDHIYLLIFELWRRLMADKPSLSIICNELDQQIYQYDQNNLENPLALYDAIAHFLSALNENVDAGFEPKEAFKRISTYCANDVETFLYDFICEQIEEENESYAHELLDGFLPFLDGDKWFELLRARLLGNSHIKSSNRLLDQLVEENLDSNDLEFNLELLSFLAVGGSDASFKLLTKKTVDLLQSEEDFQDLLSICSNYYHCLDNDQNEVAIANLMKKRANKSSKTAFNRNEADVSAFLNLIMASK